MKKSMYTIKVLLKWGLILATLYFVFTRLMLDRERVAMAAALAMLIIYVYWFPKKYTRYQTNRAEWEKKIHTSLFKSPGKFLKEKVSQFGLSDIRILFWGQVQAAVQVVVLVLYCAYNMIFEEPEYKWSCALDTKEIAVLIWIAVSILIFTGLPEIYVKYLKRSCEGKPGKPFSYARMSRRLADRFICECHSFSEINALIERNSIKQAYELWDKYDWDGTKSVYTYLRRFEDDIALDILQVIRFREFKEEYIPQLNEKYQEIIVKYFGKQQVEAFITFIFVLCVDHITEPFRKLIDTQPFVPYNMIVVPVGVSFEDPCIYIPMPYDVTLEDSVYRDIILNIFYYD